jgi:hypothetical protein
MPVIDSPEECGGFRKALAGIMKEHGVKPFISPVLPKRTPIGKSPGRCFVSKKLSGDSAFEIV